MQEASEHPREGGGILCPASGWLRGAAGLEQGLVGAGGKVWLCSGVSCWSLV